MPGRELKKKWRDVMTSVSAEIANEPSWLLYADYCKARAGNPFDQSKVAAEHFVRVAHEWSFEEKKRFSLWLMDSTGRIMKSFGRSKHESRAATGGPGYLRATHRSLGDLATNTRRMAKGGTD